MELAWAIVGIVVLLALIAASRLLRRLVLAFAIAAVGLLLLHMQTAPGEALVALGAMGGGVVLARPLRRMLWGGFPT
ncbi:hypothetical protein [Marimonas lutisalis]|uniref:hypothetical protein n=1 Tax=Marimonas lutisalis TaxID=2545756 RepID=UPI0010FA1418|nr:hypothetical protein [Marimonas lutisalis]